MADLAGISTEYYRSELRMARWAIVGVIIALATIMAVRLTLSGLDPALIPLYAGVAILDGFLFSLVYLAAGVGPSEVSVVDGTITFVYAGGRTLSIDPRRRRLRVHLTERLVPPKPSRFRSAVGPSFFLTTGIVRIALTRAAFDEISRELTRAGLATRTRKWSGALEGSWQAIEYSGRGP
jgi:hypothetical protein